MNQDTIIGILGAMGLKACGDYSAPVRVSGQFSSRDVVRHSDGSRTVPVWSVYGLVVGYLYGVQRLGEYTTIRHGRRRIKDYVPNELQTHRAMGDAVQAGVAAFIAMEGIVALGNALDDWAGRYGTQSGDWRKPEGKGKSRFICPATDGLGWVNCDSGAVGAVEYRPIIRRLSDAAENAPNADRTPLKRGDNGTVRAEHAPDFYRADCDTITAALGNLTGTKRSIAYLWARGFTGEQIANDLNLSHSRVRNAMSEIRAEAELV